MHLLSGMHERCEDRRERREERREDRRERREERREERAEKKKKDHNHHGRRDSSSSSDDDRSKSHGGYSHPAPVPSSYGGGGFSRQDYVPDNDFERKMANVSLEDERRSYGGGGYNEYETRPPTNQGYQYQEQGSYHQPAPASYGSGATYGGDQRYPAAQGGGGAYTPPAGPPPGYGGQSAYSNVPSGETQGYGGQSTYTKPPTGESYGGGKPTYSTGPSAAESQGYGGKSTYYNPPTSDSQGYEGQSTYSRPATEESPTYGNQSTYSRPPTTAGRSQGYGPTPTSESQVGGNAPAGGFLSSSRPLVRDTDDNDERPSYGNQTRPHGEADSYYNNRSSQETGADRATGQSASSYSHLPAMAAAHDPSVDPDVYHQATQGLHETIQSRPPRPTSDDESAKDRYKTHLDAHAQAYGAESEHSNAPMTTDAIGSAAAIEALKLTAGQKPLQDSEYGNAPAGAIRPNKPAGGRKSTASNNEDEESEEEDDGASASAPSAGGGAMQDKIMALAMSQAGKLFDKKNGGSGDNSDGKAQAMQSAAATAMQLFGEYKSTGKIQPTDMQKLMGVAMSLF